MSYMYTICEIKVKFFQDFHLGGIKFIATWNIMAHSQMSLLRLLLPSKDSLEKGVTTSGPPDESRPPPLTSPGHSALESSPSFLNFHCFI